jgi:hypothetical protein
LYCTVSIEPGFVTAGNGRRRDGAEAAFARVKVANGGGEIGGAEIGPHGACENEFGVCGFPEEEVAKAAFASGANQQVDGRAEGEFESVAGEFGKAAGGGEDSVAAGVVDGNAKAEFATGGGGGFGAGDGGGR